MDSNKTIFLPLAMSPAILVLDLTKGCWEPARALSSCTQKSEKQYFLILVTDEVLWEYCILHKMNQWPE